MQHWDAIVVGVGGIGSAALYHLARRGLRVLGIDRHTPPHDRGSSHGQTRIIRQAYFEHPDYVPLALASYGMWADLEAATGTKLYYQTGVVEIGPADGEVVPGVLRAAHEHSLAVSELSARDISNRWPGLRVPDDLVGVYEAEAGYLLVEHCVQAHLQAARACGAELLVNSPVENWSADGQRAGVGTPAGGHTADRLIFTGGAWAGQLLTDNGVRFTILRKPLMWYAVKDKSAYSPGRDFPAYLFELPYGVLYGFPQLDDRGVKLAEHSGGGEVVDPAKVDRQLLASDREPVERFITDHLPQVSHELTGHSVCLYTMSPDEHFIVDQLPGPENVWFCAGLSGHGFKFAPVLGRALAELATEGTTSLPIGFLSLDRFQ